MSQPCRTTGKEGKGPGCKRLVYDVVLTNRMKERRRDAGEPARSEGQEDFRRITSGTSAVWSGTSRNGCKTPIPFAAWVPPADTATI